MNEPRVPQNNKGWQAMDIYLFSNGQENSPPRKYHLQTDELQFWQATIHHLARSQYGPTHSTIDLYTLDGKRIASPLELVDAATYVAVTPPDAFIPAGYEQYLIKASRSWERRQEKLINAGNGRVETEIKEEQSKITADESRFVETSNSQNPQITKDKDQDSIGTNNTIMSRLGKENERSFDRNISTARVEQVPSRKYTDIEKYKSIRKVTAQMSKTNSKEDALNKKKNMSAFRNSKNISSRRQSLKNDPILNKNNNVIKTSKELPPNVEKTMKDMEIKDTIMLSKPEDFHSEFQSREQSKSGFDKGIIVISDVYKNPESEVQSVFIDADRKNPRDYLPKERFKSTDLQKIVELEENDNAMKTNKASSAHSGTCFNMRPEIATSFGNKNKVFNIKLNIELRDNRDSLGEQKSGHLIKCKSVTELFNRDQGSQATIDVILNCDYIKTHDDNLIRKSMLTENTYLCDSNDPKMTKMKCCLDRNSTLSKGKENYVLFVPAAFVDKNFECCRCNSTNNQDKDPSRLSSVVATDSIDIKSDAVSRDNSQVTIKHKVSICPDSPVKISAELPSIQDKDVDPIPIPQNTPQPITVSTKTDNYTQTDWCDVLLQACPQGNGLSSFHLPPLRVLVQYNLL
ncbi:uncharacterized protein LOC116770048 [Danaus plexippus]|uniref:uncharacterized protein LOC116770048 n=1 Tax=Danaus plexippus TaxID=13037 RepID=UPI002AB0287C|nr:uncharacterized protein LOC116770048 [Danaus plexippus]